MLHIKLQGDPAGNTKGNTARTVRPRKCNVEKEERRKPDSIKCCLWPKLKTQNRPLRSAKSFSARVGRHRVRTQIQTHKHPLISLLRSLCRRFRHRDCMWYVKVKGVHCAGATGTHWGVCEQTGHCHPMTDTKLTSLSSSRVFSRHWKARS